MDRKIIKEEAKKALVGKRLMLLVVMIIVGIIGGGLMTIGIGILIAPLLAVGLFYIVKDILFGKEIDAERFIEPFKDLNHAIRVIVVNVLVILIIVVGTFLLIIPGIIFSLMLTPALFIIAEDKEIGIMDTLKKSKEMMKGYKMDLFIFNLSFIGHYILTVITFGIYGFYFFPYLETAVINYYLHLTKQNIKEINNVQEAEYFEV